MALAAGSGRWAPRLTSRRRPTWTPCPCDAPGTSASCRGVHQNSPRRARVHRASSASPCWTHYGSRPVNASRRGRPLFAGSASEPKELSEHLWPGIVRCRRHQHDLVLCHRDGPLRPAATDVAGDRRRAASGLGILAFRRHVRYQARESRRRVLEHVATSRQEPSLPPRSLGLVAPTAAISQARGFNEPGSSLGGPTRIKTLTESTRRDNARFFPSIDDVPLHVLTDPASADDHCPLRPGVRDCFGQADILGREVEPRGHRGPRNCTR